MAIRNHVPIVPIGIIGAEEQLPSIFSSQRLGEMFGIEAVPIPLIPFPLPVRYRIFYGEPITEHLSLDSYMADDPDVVSELLSKSSDVCTRFNSARSSQEKRDICMILDEKETR